VRLDPHQVGSLNAERRFNVRVWARRSGKTYYTIIRQLMRLEARGTGDYQGFYFAPTRTQAKQIAWPYLTQFSKPLGAELNQAELKCTIPGKGFIQLMNGEQYDRARGLYMDDCVLDEAADIPEAALREVISPALSDRKGTLDAMGTPRGRMNLLYKLWEEAGANPDLYSRSLLTWEQAGRVDATEIERNKALMTDAQFRQEWLCSWDGATPGAYWGQEMSDAESSGRVTLIRRDEQQPLIAAIDLGHSDLMPVIWGHEIGNQFQVVMCKTYQFTGFPALVQDWKQMGMVPDRLIAPHDINVTELGSGKTRLEVLRGFGLDVVVAPKLSLAEGIEQTRQFLKRCWFDRENTAFLREGLAQYRSEYDAMRGVHRLTPIHDQASHYADAMRYLATGDRNLYAYGQSVQPAFKGVV